MTFKAFGSLEVGTHFLWRRERWVKVPFSVVEKISYNAYSIVGKTIQKIDDASLVNLDTDIIEEEPYSRIVPMAKFRQDTH